MIEETVIVILWICLIFYATLVLLLIGTGTFLFFESLLDKVAEVKKRNKNIDNLTEIDYEYLKIFYKDLENYKYKTNWNNLYEIKYILNFSNYGVLLHLERNNNYLTICFLNEKYTSHSYVSHNELLTNKCKHKIILSPRNSWYKAIYNLYYLDEIKEKQEFILNNKNNE